MTCYRKKFIFLSSNFVTVSESSQLKLKDQTLLISMAINKQVKRKKQYCNSNRENQTTEIICILNHIAPLSSDVTLCVIHTVSNLYLFLPCDLYHYMSHFEKDVLILNVNKRTKVMPVPSLDLQCKRCVQPPQMPVTLNSALEHGTYRR